MKEIFLFPEFIPSGFGILRVICFRYFVHDVNRDVGLFFLLRVLKQLIFDRVNKCNPTSFDNIF